jgi:FkbM family methyltransferase
VAGVDPQRTATGVPGDGQGQRYYGQFDPPVDRFLHERYFADRSGPGVLIECGAFDGVTESSCKFFEESLGWTAYNLEASPRIFEALCRNRPHSHNLNLALSNRQGEAEFHDCSIPGFELTTNGSLKHLDPHRAWLDSMQCRYRTSVVHTTTFRDLVERLQLARIDLMVLDVEGHELEVLEGFTGAAAFPRVLCVEHGHLGVPAVRAAVERHGYVFDATAHVNSFFVR